MKYTSIIVVFVFVFAGLHFFQKYGISTTGVHAEMVTPQESRSQENRSGASPLPTESPTKANSPNGIIAGNDARLPEPDQTESDMSDTEITRQVVEAFHAITLPAPLAADGNNRYAQLKPLINATAFLAHEMALGAVKPDQDLLEKMARFTVYQMENMPTDELLNHLAAAYELHSQEFEKAFLQQGSEVVPYILQKLNAISAADKADDFSL